MLISLGIATLIQLSAPIFIYKFHKYHDKKIATQLAVLFLIQAMSFITLCSISFIKMFSFQF